jgi:hypothetical protein
MVSRWERGDVVSGDVAQFASAGGGLGAVGDAELAVDALGVPVGGADGDGEVSGNFRVGVAAGEEAQNVALTGAEGFGWRAGGIWCGWESVEQDIQIAA